jgi:hypothetical protein
VQVCNDPLSSRLHVPGADAALADHCVPAAAQLGGKLAVLTHILQRLVPAGALPRAVPVVAGCMWQPQHQIVRMQGCLIIEVLLSACMPVETLRILY